TDSNGLNPGGWGSSVAVFGGQAGGTVTVQGTQAFDTLQFSTSGYQLSGGQLAIASATGTQGAINVDAGITADIATAIVNGTGNSLFKVGTGTLTLSGANTYTGATTVNGGTLALSGSSSLDTQGAVALTGNTARFDISAANGNRTIGALSGVTGSSIALGARSLTFGDSTNPSFGGVIGGTGGLVKQGIGTTTFTAANTYSGGTTINAGTLALRGTGSLHAQGAVALTGTARFDISRANDDRTIGALSGGMSSSIVLGAHNLTFGDDTDQRFEGGVRGAGGLVKQGTGTTTLGGVSTYTGGTTVNAGTLAIASTSALGAGQVVLHDGAELLSTVSGSLGPAQLIVTDGRISAADNQRFAVSAEQIGRQNAGGTLRIGSAGHAGTVQLGVIRRAAPVNVHVDHGTLQYGAPGFGSAAMLSISGGSLNIAAGATADLNGNTVDASHLRGDGLITNSAPAQGTATLRAGTGSTADSIFTGTIEDGTGGISLQKSGSHTLTLSGTNTYTGITTINAGTLAVNGAVAGNVRVNNTGTLGGSGVIGGNVNLVSGATLSAGNSPGTLTVNGDLTLGSGSTSVFELGQAGVVGGTANDLVVVGGNLQLGGRLQATAASAGWYRLFNYGGALSGAFDSDNVSSSTPGFTVASH
ncbi:beta strand repeat-containing protein, partial [Hydrogenophaga palleronii]|uniref:beta strand repeat-containing protein n=1 Tax=Hydrogenophaga palleronii TaxID=65655 RepID=UPI000AB9205A